MFQPEMQGGGFLHEGNDQSSQKDTKGGDLKSKKNNLCEVSFDEIRKLSHPDHGLVIHRQLVHVVSTIGRVDSINIQTVKCTYMVRDETGPPIEVVLWNQEKGNIPIRDDIKEKTLVRIYGTVRFNEGRLFLMAFKVVPITNLNEISSHILTSIYHSMVLQKKKYDLSSMQAEDVTMAPSGFDSHSNSDSNKLYKTVLDFISKHEGEAGIHASAIGKGLRHIDQNSIKKALNWLADEAHIYSTDDNGECFKSTGSNC